jgi:hypothetical protein
MTHGQASERRGVGQLLIASLIGLAVAAIAPAAEARELQISGTTGYLSEWRFEVVLARNATDEEFAGPLRWKHVGLCSANGSEERSGEINVHIRHMGPLSRVNATVSFEKLKCTYSGPFSPTVKGFMECSDRTSLPLTLSFN